MDTHRADVAVRRPSDSGKSRTRLVPRWCSTLLLVLGVLTLPWTAGLAMVLPSSERSAHYDVSWTGFDLLLCALLLRTGWSTSRRRADGGLSAAMTGTLLVVDAWFDVLSAPDTPQFLTALAMALVVELPLAAMCMWIAVHSDPLRSRERKPEKNPRLEDQAASS